MEAWPGTLLIVVKKGTYLGGATDRVAGGIFYERISFAKSDWLATFRLGLPDLERDLAIVAGWSMRALSYSGTG